jgi:hypothetical protein
LVKHTIRQHYQDKLQSDTGDLKKTWKTINELMNKSKKDTKISELRTDNEMIDLSQIPNAFNKYLIELGGKLCNDIAPSAATPEDYFADFEYSMTNYRPISFISIVARIMEKLVHNQIYEYLIKSNLLSIYQHGFRPLHSTVSALLDITNRWYQNMDIGQLTGVIFVDLKKAFDMVNHEILLKS